MNTITKKIKSDPSLLPEIEEWIISLLKTTSLNKEKIDVVAMAASEAVSNCVVHGNKSDPDKSVSISFSSDGNKIVLKFKDEGSGFKIERVPDPTSKENIMKESGRGIHIMKTVLDSLEYNFTDDGTEAILTVNLETEMD